MNSLNGPGVPHRHQWRSDIGKKNLATYDARREAMANHLSRNHVVASAICCTRKNCDKIKWEQLEKVFFSDGGSPIYPQCSVPFQACRDPPGFKKDANGFPENFCPAYCPCMVNRGHLVAYCCMRRDCDDASKIGERSPAYSHFKY